MEGASGSLPLIPRGGRARRVKNWEKRFAFPERTACLVPYFTIDPLQLRSAGDPRATNWAGGFSLGDLSCTAPWRPKKTQP